MAIVSSVQKMEFVKVLAGRTKLVQKTLKTQALPKVVVPQEIWSGVFVAITRTVMVIVVIQREEIVVPPISQ